MLRQGGSFRTTPNLRRLTMDWVPTDEVMRRENKHYARWMFWGRDEEQKALAGVFSPSHRHASNFALPKVYRTVVFQIPDVGQAHVEAYVSARSYEEGEEGGEEGETDGEDARVLENKEDGGEGEEDEDEDEDEDEREHAEDMDMDIREQDNSGWTVTKDAKRVLEVELDKLHNIMNRARSLKQNTEHLQYIQHLHLVQEEFDDAYEEVLLFARGLSLESLLLQGCIITPELMDVISTLSTLTTVHVDDYIFTFYLWEDMDPRIFFATLHQITLWNCD
ncbi:hypothetical protein M422DRAFT_250510 [Sphaerobolus stellatus SS14]|uniref:Uncharacterized protein n=1 Tax=Sphaerobolus stellatus (strain SS14) TaxID=990650 RepID=A0A0C9W455_SPHS4|nr:hypothetical protein M422DRAFT_250510 [Sphaerobolus stellatus SS14]